MLAWLAKEEDLLKAFAAGRDVYSEFSSQIYGRTITKDQKLERYVGKTAILGLGYGMGHAKFRATLKAGSPSVDISEKAALIIVSQYRALYPKITRLWNASKQLLFTMLNNNQAEVTYGLLTVKHNSVQLPNKMHLKYPKLTYTKGQFVYFSGKNLIYTHGARVTENIIQALARIVITDQMLEVQKLKGVSIVMQIHDEIVSIAIDSNPDETLEQILAIMKTPPSWCSDLPLDAEGSYGKSYDK